MFAERTKQLATNFQWIIFKFHLESNKIELILLQINEATIGGFYRPFLLPNHNNDIEYIEETTSILQRIESKKIVILGDFNIDYIKLKTQDYPKTNLYDILENFLIEKTMVQIVKRVTWQRKFKDTLIESILDHIYINNIMYCENIINQKQVVGDHNLIGLSFRIEDINYPTSYPTQISDWSNYSVDKLNQRLMDCDFSHLDGMNVQQHTSELNQILGTILDELVPTITIRRKEIPGFISIKHIKQRRRRKNLYKKYKRTGDKRYLERSRDLEKEIKKDIKKLKSKKIRSKIKPGDSKSLWQAVNLSMNNLQTPLPEVIVSGDISARNDEEKADK